MSTKIRSCIAVLATLFLCLLAPTAFSQGTAFTYQGHLQDNGQPANGLYDFQFSVFNVAAGGAAIAGPLATNAVPVSNGLFTVRLEFGSGVFTGPGRWLQVETRTNGPGVLLGLMPRTELTPSPYSIFSGTASTVPNASIGTAQLAANSVNSSHIIDGQVATADLANNAVNSAKVVDGSLVGADLANNTITALQVTDDLDLGQAGVGGRLDIYNTTAGTPALSLVGTATGGYQYLYANDGSAGIFLDGDSGGAGLVYIYNTNGSVRVALDGAGSGSGGQATIYAQDGSSTVQLYGESGAAGLISVNNNVSSSRVSLDGESTGGGGEVSVLDGTGTETVELLGASLTNLGGILRLRQADGSVGVEVSAEGYAGDGGLISLKNASGTEKLEVDGDDGDGAPAIRLKNAAGTTTITIDGDLSGDGRITTQELQITGGSDLSEQFDIQTLDQAVTPGSIVCIDPSNPGQLAVSARAYDRTVAGVVSGAGGVKPGMLMGQIGTIATGRHPVALTGRVYCLADASQGEIRPGDLITTSDLPGHGMKVTDHARAQGAIIGKAMTGLKDGKGLVLVLVSLQ
jgi:hypothetical protein